MIDISHYDKALVLMALFNHAKILHSKFLGYPPPDLTHKQAEAHLKESAPRYHFEIFQGRNLQINLSGDELNPILYDRANGESCAAHALRMLPSPINGFQKKNH